MRRCAWLLLAIGTLAMGSAVAAPGTRSSGAHLGSARRTPAAAPHRASTARDTSRAAAPDSAQFASRPGRGARTLDDIHIEGEIPVPQVLFITARDQRRLMTFRHRSYWRTSRRLGEDTASPSSIVVAGASTNAEKEMER